MQQQKAENPKQTYTVVYWKLWQDLYGRYRNQRISYMMHQVANALAMARRAEICRTPNFALHRKGYKSAR